MLIKRKRRYKNSSKTSNYDNLLRYYEPERSNQLFISDITYLSLKDSFRYLFLTEDYFSRKITGWVLSKNMYARSAVLSFKQALRNIGARNSLIIHHSDKGTQYMSDEFITMCRNNNIIISTTYRGDCYDNARCERINNILKKEYMLGQKFTDEITMKKAIKQAISLYITKNHTKH